MSASEASAATPTVRDQIPKAEFIEDLDAFMAKEGSAEVAIEKQQRLYQALKFIEQKLTQRRAKLKHKMPEMEATFASLKQMEAQAALGEPLTTHYELAQSVFAKAKVPVHEDDKVCLWLGANVMLEYPRSEAILLLEDNLKNAKQALVTVTDDMGYLRDQITTTEVNMARVFNWDVKERRKKKEAEAAGKPES